MEKNKELKKKVISFFLKYNWSVAFKAAKEALENRLFVAPDLLFVFLDD